MICTEGHRYNDRFESCPVCAYVASRPHATTTPATPIAKVSRVSRKFALLLVLGGVSVAWAGFLPWFTLASGQTTDLWHLATATGISPFGPLLLGAGALVALSGLWQLRRDDERLRMESVPLFGALVALGVVADRLPQIARIVHGLNLRFVASAPRFGLGIWLAIVGATVAILGAALLSNLGNLRTRAFAGATTAIVILIGTIALGHPFSGVGTDSTTGTIAIAAAQAELGSQLITSKPLGTSISMNDPENGSISVTVAKVIDPATTVSQGNSLSVGSRVIAVALNFRETGGMLFSDLIDQGASLIGGNGARYGAISLPIVGCSSPANGSIQLLPNAAGSLCVEFNVPVGVAPRYFSYRPSFDLSGGATWSLAAPRG